MNLDEEEIERRIHKYLTSDRRRAMEIEEEEDIEIMLAENPPEPEEMPEMMAEVKRVKVVA